MQLPKMLRMSEVMAITGYSRGKAYALVVSGELPALRSGRSVRVPLDALKRWIEANTSGGDLVQ